MQTTRAETEAQWQVLTKPLQTKAPWHNCKHHTAGHAQQQMRKMDRLTKSTAWKIFCDSKQDGHVSAMWKHLLATKGQSHVTEVVEVRKLLRKLNLNLNGTIKC